MKIEGKEESNYEIIKFCSNLLKEGCEQTNFVISHSLFWIITIYLTTMTLSTYLAISFLFEFDDGGALPTKIGTLVGSLFITSTIIYVYQLCVSRSSKKCKSLICVMKKCLF